MEVNKAILIVDLTKEAEIHNVRETINQYKYLNNNNFYFNNI